MNIRLAQTGAVLGDVEKNLERHLRTIAQAQRDEVDLLVFPELSLTGYLLRDLVTEVAMPLEDLAQRLTEGLVGRRPIEFVVGYVEEDEHFRFYNAAAHFRFAGGGLSLLHNHRKVNLPTYGMFDEHRYFTAGSRVRAYDSPMLGRCGLLICEDMWHLANPLILSLDGPEHNGMHALIGISNSPSRGIADGGRGTPRNLDLWDRLTMTYAQILGVMVVQCHRVGVEEGLIFSGGSQVVTPEGEVAARATALEETILDAPLDVQAVLRRARIGFRGRSGDDYHRLVQELLRMEDDEAGRQESLT